MSDQWALAQLRSGDIYHDNGRHIVFLARSAEVTVHAIHVDLTTLKTTHYTVTPEGKRETHTSVAQRDAGSTGNQPSRTVRTRDRAAVSEEGGQLAWTL